MNSHKWKAIRYYTYIAVLLLYLINYSVNIIKFIKLDFKEPFKTEVIRGLGIFAYGGFIGFMNIGEENKTNK